MWIYKNYLNNRADYIISRMHIEFFSKADIECYIKKIKDAINDFFRDLQEAQTLIDTTSVMKEFNRQLRKAAKFPTDDSLLIMLYLV